MTPFTARQDNFGKSVTTGRVPREPRPDQSFPWLQRLKQMKSLLLNDLFLNLSAGFLLGAVGVLALQAV
ncbi:MAG: hypothetical protein H2056_03710 [Sphingopyxis sp.]|nr:hypothetical protein [Sphingopyxis sp.]